MVSTSVFSAYTLFFLVVILGIVALFPFFYEYNSDDLDPFAPIFWITPWFFFTFGATAVIRVINSDFSFKGFYSGPMPPTPIFIQILALTIFGLVSLEIGYYFNFGPNINRWIPNYDHQWDSRRIWVAITFLLIIGYIGYLALKPSLGTGPRSRLPKGGTKYAFIAVNFLLSASVLLLADLFITGIDIEDYHICLTGGSFRKFIIVSLLVLVNISLLWDLGGRGRAFGILVIAVFLFHYLVRPFRFREWLPIYTVIEVMPAWSAEIAANVITTDIDALSHIITNPYLFKKTPTFAFNNVSILIAGIPEYLRFQYGVTFLSAFFELSSFKPFPEAHQVYNHAFLQGAVDSYGVSLTLLGELYLNFYIPGVVFGLFLAGYAMRTIYQWAVLPPKSTGSLVLFSAISNNFLMKGNFSNTVPALGLLLLPLILALMYALWIPYLNTYLATNSG